MFSEVSNAIHHRPGEDDGELFEVWKRSDVSRRSVRCRLPTGVVQLRLNGRRRSHCLSEVLEFHEVRLPEIGLRRRTNHDVRKTDAQCLLFRGRPKALQKLHGAHFVTATVKDDKVTVVIENNGTVLSDEDLHQLSVPFVSATGPGYGLGVPISLSLAEANGGHLSFTRRAEGGLSAVVTLRKA